MRRIFPAFCAMFLLMGCATNGVDTGDSNLDKDLAQAAPSVSIVEPNSSTWCQTAASCKYIGEEYCTAVTRSQKKAHAECRKNLAIKTIMNGGDTFVVQDAGIISGYIGLNPKEEYFRTYGQIYNCGNKFSPLHARYKALGKAKLEQPVVFQSAAYAKLCKTMNKCTSYKYQGCSTIQNDPFNLCVKKFNRNYLGGSSSLFDHAIVSREVFNKAGSYRIFADLFKCQ